MPNWTMFLSYQPRLIFTLLCHGLPYSLGSVEGFGLLLRIFLNGYKIHRMSQERNPTPSN